MPKNEDRVYLAYRDAVNTYGWDNITPEPDYDVSHRPEPTPEQEAEDAQEPTITIVMFS